MNNEKVKTAIDRLRAFQPKDGTPYYLCFSGGKDSDCIRILAQLANVPHDIVHNLTTVDAPETIRYIRTIPNVIINKSRYTSGCPKTMWNLIVDKQFPPTRLIRYCCAELKEHGGKGRLKITGVRAAESPKRAKNGGVVKIIGSPVRTHKYFEKEGIQHSDTPMGGIILNYDNSDSRRAVEHCFRTTNTMINPIIDWSDSDVWDFLRFYGCASNPLYQCGETRIGCIGCPLSGAKGMRRDFIKYPKYKALYIKAFDRMLIAREKAGKINNLGWKNGYDVFRWWIGEDINQFTLFDSEEINSLIDSMGG